MVGLPEVTVAGTLTADPEVVFVASGDAVTNFTIAANDRRYDRDSGQWVDAGATFLRCSAWRHMAEHISESLYKGDRVLVTGSLKQRSWETNDGDKRTVLELAVTEIGPSLKFATAVVTKAHRSSGKPAGTDEGTAPQPTAGSGFSDEPPF